MLAALLLQIATATVVQCKPGTFFVRAAPSQADPYVCDCQAITQTTTSTTTTKPPVTTTSTTTSTTATLPIEVVCAGYQTTINQFNRMLLDCYAKMKKCKRW